MDAKSWTGDDDRDALSADQPDAPMQHCPDGECECHCDRCGAELIADPSFGIAKCGDCYGGAKEDGEAFRGGEAAAYLSEQQAAAQRLKR